MAKAKTVINKGGPGNTVRLNRKLFDFDKINPNLLNRAGLELVKISFRAAWGLNKGAQPQSKWFYIDIDKDTRFRAREWKRNDVTEAVMFGKDFFDKRKTIKSNTPYITWKIFKVCLRHKTSGNIYKGVVKGQVNQNSDTRELYIMKMNTKKHNSLSGPEYGAMLDDLKLIMIDACHYSYQSARIVVCPVKK